MLRLKLKFNNFEFLLNLNVNISSNLINQKLPETVENIEINTTYVDDFKEYYSENNYLERVNSSSRLALSGLETYDWWATKHPVTKKPVVGVVVTWTPNASENSSKINKELKQQPDF